MAKIEGLRIKNFRMLKDITLGKLWNTRKARPLTPLTAVIGRNGAGKSTLFDAFGFLADCLKNGVEEACGQNGRGGFEKIRSQGSRSPIEFEIYYKQHGSARPITYELTIDLDKHSRPYVAKELFRQWLKVRKANESRLLMFLGKGKGTVLKYRQNEMVELEDNRKLGIAILGSLRSHPEISTFRRFMEGWYMSCFDPDAARDLPLAGAQKHLNAKGDNLGNVVQYMEREHKARFQRILEKIAGEIPGLDKIDTLKTPDGRLLLQFNDRGFQDPFYAHQMSDGTLKMFFCLLLLADPNPPPFICIKEPENGLYHKLLETLAGEFREHATGKKGGSQIFITTHQPYFVNGLNPNEVWILEKGEDGFSSIRRADGDSRVNRMIKEGLSLGELWHGDHLDAR